MSTMKSLTPDLHMAGGDGPVRRVIMAVDGLDKHGKTTFALSAPKPLVYMDFDIGSEGVLHKAPNPEGILATKPFLFRPSEIAWETENDAVRNEKIMQAADPELTRFRRTYMKALTEPVVEIDGKKRKARTVVIDTGGELWELLRLCEFGKLSQVKPHHYVKVNGIMRDLVRAGFESDVNVIWLHKLKAEWKDGPDGKGRKTGTLERSGFSDMSYLVQANLLAYRVPAEQGDTVSVKWKSGEGVFDVPLEPRSDPSDLGFRIVVGNSRHDATLEGQVMEGPMATFPFIASMMIPGTSPEDWV